MIDSEPLKDYIKDDTKHVIEDNLNKMMLRKDSMLLTVEPSVAYRYKGDFFGLMEHYKISTVLFWPALRCNGFTSPEEYDEELSVKIPSIEMVQTLLRRQKIYDKQLGVA
jgi:hypothetical protein